MEIVLNILGIFTFFWVRFTFRKNKTKGNWKFWFNDNFEEMVSIALFDTILMILLLRPETQIGLDAWLQNHVPLEVHVAIKPAASAIIGLFFAWFFYTLYNRKVKNSKK